MIVVADTSPIHYLILIECEFVLPRLYSEILVPHAVFSELTDSDTPEEVRRWMAAPPGWMSILEQVVPAPRVGSLGAGESAGIMLAERLNADLILIDDAAARREAKRRGLSVAGTLGVLKSAAEEDWLDLSEAFAKLRKTGFYVDPAVLEELLRRH